MRSKGLAAIIVLAGITYAGVGYVQTYPHTLASRVIHTAIGQGQQQFQQQVHQATQVAQQYVRSAREVQGGSLSHHPAAYPTTHAVALPRSLPHLVPPTNVIVEQYGTTHLILEWAPVPHVTGYRVIGQAPNQPTVPTIIQTTGTWHVRLNPLTPGTRYALQVESGWYHQGHWTWSAPSVPIHRWTWTPWSDQTALYAWAIGTTWEKQSNGTGGYNQGTTFRLMTSPNGPWAPWNGVWLTCAHAVSNDTQGPDLTVQLHQGATPGAIDGQRVWAEQTGLDFTHDLASIQLDGYTQLYYQNLTTHPNLPSVDGIPINTHPLWVGEPIMILGHPLGRRLTASIGTLTALGIPNWKTTDYGTIPFMLTGNAWAAGGNSGSPVLNPWGQVIGVDESGRPNGSHFEGIVPITAVRQVPVVNPHLPDYPPTVGGNIQNWFQGLF